MDARRAARNKVVPLPDVGKEDPQNLLYAGVMSRAEEAEAAEIRKKMAALEKQYHEELKKELTGSVMDECEGGEEASVPDSKQIAKDNVDMLTVMMPRKDRKLCEAIEIGQGRKKAGVERIKARKESLRRCKKV